MALGAAALATNEPDNEFFMFATMWADEIAAEEAPPMAAAGVAAVVPAAAAANEGE